MWTELVMRFDEPLEKVIYLNLFYRIYSEMTSSRNTIFLS